ncbi:uncharacterized protein LOC129585109 isoform X2 [Paramacrobiotus metropolitanus]|uniref:uncharacterized protein LOC129585109 isoform X2 n=1 Tax=Paramacrobiotus metropolitanus TaxID=2943436 RepID=UPI0024464727|nr:uncharacterized protein LOC129585109 isoform X2 [Paramacrobiotus metropolitanus]
MSGNQEPRRSARLQTRDPHQKSKLHEDFETETKKPPASANAAAVVGTKNKRGRPCKPKPTDDEAHATASKDPEVVSGNAGDKLATDSSSSSTVSQMDNEAPAVAAVISDSEAGGSSAAKQQTNKSSVPKRLAHTRSLERKPGRPPGRPPLSGDTMPASTSSLASEKSLDSAAAVSRPVKSPVIVTQRSGTSLPVFTKPATRMTSIVKTPLAAAVVKPPVRAEGKEYASILSVGRPRSSTTGAEQPEKHRLVVPFRDPSTFEAKDAKIEHAITTPEPVPLRRYSTGIGKQELAADNGKPPAAPSKGDFTVERITRPRAVSSHVPKKTNVAEKLSGDSASAVLKSRKEPDDSDVTGSISGSSGVSIASTGASSGKSVSSVTEKNTVQPPAHANEPPQRTLKIEPSVNPRSSNRPGRLVVSQDQVSRASSSHSASSEEIANKQIPKLILQKVKKNPTVCVRTPVSVGQSTPSFRSNPISPHISPEKAKVTPPLSDSGTIKKAAKSVQKIPTGTSVIIRRGDINKAPLPDVPVVSTESSRNIPPSTVTAETKPAQTGTINSVATMDMCPAVVDSMSSSHVDETIDEVSKGNFVRSIDSDSTLTASETEAIEARMRENRKTKKDPDSPKRPVNKRQKIDGGASVDPLVAIQGSSGRKSKKDVGSPKKASNYGEKKPVRSSSPGTVTIKTEPNSVEDEVKREKPTFDSNPMPMDPDTNESENRVGTPTVPQTNGKEASNGTDAAPPVEVKPDIPKLAYVFVSMEDFSDSEDDCSSLISDDLSVDSLTSRKLLTSVSVPCPSVEPMEEVQDTRFRTRMRSMSVLSDGPMDVASPVPLNNIVPTNDVSQITTAAPATEKGSHKKKSAAQKEVHKIGTMPLTDLGRWKPRDDMKLIMAVLEYRDLLVVHKHAKFSCHFTYVEIQERWFNLLYNKKIAKAACQAMRSSPPDIMRSVQRETPFTEAEEALLLEIPLIAEPVDISTFEVMLEANPNVFPPFRVAEDLYKHWQVLLAEGRIENSDTICTVPEDSVVINTERITSFAEMESKMKDADLKNWTHVSGEFAYEMDKLHRQNRERLMNVDKEIEHLRFLLEKAMNYELPDFTRPEFSSPQDRSFVAVLLGQRAKYGLRTGKVSFGRCVPGHIVDVDLSVEGYAGRVSRLQGYVILERNGIFRIENHGRRPITVDEKVLHYGDFCVLPDEAVVQISDIFLQFFVNTSRVLRFLRQKYYGEWVSDEEGEEPDKDRKKALKNSKKAAKPKKVTDESISDMIPLDIHIPLPSQPKPKKARAKPKKLPPETDASASVAAVVLDNEAVLPPPKPKKPSPRKPKPAPPPSEPPVDTAPPPPVSQSPAMEFAMRLMGQNHMNSPPRPPPPSTFMQTNQLLPPTRPVLAHPAFSLIPPLPHHLISSSGMSSPVTSPTISPPRSSTLTALRLPSISDLVPKAASPLLHSPIMETRSPLTSPKSSPTRPRPMVRSPVMVRSYEPAPTNPNTPHIMRAPPMRSFAPMMDSGQPPLPTWTLAPLRNTAPSSESPSGVMRGGVPPTSLVGFSVLSAGPGLPTAGAKKSFNKAKTVCGGQMGAMAVQMGDVQQQQRLENGVQQESMVSNPTSTSA